MISKKLSIFAHDNMNEQEKDIQKWYVIGTTTARHELQIRDRFRKNGIESHVPLMYEITKVKGGQNERRLVPAIAGLVFAKTSYNLFREYQISAPDNLFLRKSSYTNHEDYLTVGEKDMERFINITSAHPEDVTYFTPGETTVHEGELVKIQIGSKEYEAEIKRVSGKRGKQLVVEVPGVAFAAIRVTPELMRRITRLSQKKEENRRQKYEKSRLKALAEKGQTDLRKRRNLEVDKKACFDIARRQLFNITEEHRDDVENQMARAELERIRERLKGRKGVIAAQEGELALALYLASMVLQTETQEATARLERAIEQLKTTSMLRMKMEFFLAKFNGDKEKEESIHRIVQSWNKLRLTARQKEFLDAIDEDR
jgi:hypothetical protein